MASKKTSQLIYCPVCGNKHEPPICDKQEIEAEVNELLRGD